MKKLFVLQITSHGFITNLLLCNALTKEEAASYFEAQLKSKTVFVDKKRLTESIYEVPTL
jgi:hypothetical protein